MRLYTLNPDTGKVIPGLQLAEFDLGGITEPSLIPQAGVVLLRGNERRLLPLSASRPPLHENGTLLEAELGEAYVAQECFGKETPRTYNVLGIQARANLQTILAIPQDPQWRMAVRILRFKEGGTEAWVDHLQAPITSAPAGSGESLALGSAYALHELQHHDSFGGGWYFTERPSDHPPADVLRVTVGDRDWVVELRPKKRVPLVALPFDRWQKRERYIDGLVDSRMSGSLL